MINNDQAQKDIEMDHRNTNFPWHCRPVRGNVA